MLSDEVKLVTITVLVTVDVFLFCSSQKKHLPELDHAAIATRATQMVERLSEENQALRQELKSYYKKVSTLEKVS